MASFKIATKRIKNDFWLSVMGTFNGQQFISSSFQWINNKTIKINLVIDPWPDDSTHIASMSKFEQHYNLRDIFPGNYTVVLGNDSRTFSV